MSEPDENAISEALEQIRAQLIAGENPINAIADAAEGYDLPVLLVKNRAHKLLGNLDTYASRRAEYDQSVSIASANRKRDQEQTEIAAAKHLVPRGVSRLQWQYDVKAEPGFQGREFRLGNATYVFLLRVPTNRVWSIYAIDVRSRETVRLSRSSWHRIEQQLVS